MKVHFDKLQLRDPVRPPGKNTGGGGSNWFSTQDGFTMVLDTDAGLIAISNPEGHANHDGSVRLVHVGQMLWADPLMPVQAVKAPAKAQPQAKTDH